MFLASVGPNAYKLLKNLCSPTQPSTKNYGQLKQLLAEHYKPAPIVIAERHKFWTAHQQERESVADFVVRLKNLASTCSFGTFLSQALRDRLVSGLHPKMSRVQRQLLSVRDLTFEDARAKCIAEEMAGAANKQHMGGAASGASGAHRVDHRPKQPRSSKQHHHAGKPSGSKPTYSDRKCKCCGGDHRKEDCKFKAATCHNCKKKGHIRPVCRSMKSNHNKYVDSDSDDSDSETVNVPTDTDKHTMYNIGECNRTFSPYIVNVKLGSAWVDMEIDTGASRSTVSEEVYFSKLQSYPLSQANITLRSYSGEEVPLLGSITVPVTVGGSPTFKLDLLVVKGKRPALFGRDWLSKIKLNWDSILAVKQETSNNQTKTAPHKPKSDLNSLLKQHERLFTNSGSGIKGFKASPEAQTRCHAHLSKGSSRSVRDTRKG